MTYSEGNQYRPISVWDIYTRDSKSEPWVKLRSVTQDETHLIEAENRRAGWQAYAISRRTVSVEPLGSPENPCDCGNGETLAPCEHWQAIGRTQ